jgi:phage host-nuclease inhibitor protein Gam
MAKEVKVTRSDFEKAAGEYYEASHEISSINAAKSLKIHEIEKEFEEQLRIAKTKKEVSESAMTKFCTDNKDLLLTTKSKTGEVGRVKYSFRTGSGKLVLLDGSTWETVLEKAKAELPDYVRQVEEIEKDKIIKDFDLLKERLGTIGVKVEKEDTIGFKLKD